MNEFAEAIEREKNGQVKELATELCKLFTIVQAQRLAEPIIEGGFVCPQKWATLAADKEKSMRTIRPHTAVLLDSFAIPDKYLRSEVVHGSPYQNFLNRARECEINTAVNKSAL
jgi:hypothetical protein